MSGLVPPVTADRLITGISWWSADSNGVSHVHRKSWKTKTKMVGMDVASGGCKGGAGSSGSDATVIREKGQTVTFAITAGVPLSRGHAVWWYAGSTSAHVFKVAAGTDSLSGTLTCGAMTWDPVAYKVSSDWKFISVDIPDPATAVGTPVVGAYAAACAAGEVTLTIR